MIPICKHQPGRFIVVKSLCPAYYFPSQFLIMQHSVVHAREEVKYPTPVVPPPAPLHSSIPALPGYTALTSPTPPDLPFFPACSLLKFGCQSAVASGNRH